MGKNRNTPNVKTLLAINVYVKARLKEIGLTQTKLAKRIGWSESSITNLLKKNNWTAYELDEIGKAMGENLHQQYIEAPAEPMVPASEVEAVIKENVDKDAKIEKLEKELGLMTARYEGALAAKQK